MKAKCPHCKGGCDKCEDGYWEVTVSDKNMFVMICMNLDQCGFEMGGCFSDGHPDEKPENCCMCGKPTEWIPVEEYSPTEPPAWIQNQKKLRLEKAEKTIERLLEKQTKLREFFLSLIPAEMELTVNQSQMLRVCRICKRPESAPFVFNYGEEYAHEGCLNERQGSQRTTETGKPD